MKQKSSMLITLSALVLVVTITSCTKQGPGGATGRTGNANVIVSAWTGGFSGIFAQWQVPAITQTVLDSSAVLVYARLGSNEDMVQLPWAATGGLIVNDDINIGVIELYCSSSGNLSGYHFRYVIIPQGVATTGMPRSYAEMAARFGIAP